VRNREAERVFAAWLAAEQPDLVHVHHATGFGLGLLVVARSLGVPVVMTLHDYWALCPRGQMLHVAGEVCAGLEPHRCGACLRMSFPHLMPTTGARHLGPFDSVDAEGVATPEPERLDLTDVADPDALVADRRTGFALECLLAADLLVTPSRRTAEIFATIGAGVGLGRERIEVVENGIDVDGLATEVARLRAARPADQAGAAVRLGIVGSVLPSKGVLELAEVFAAARLQGLLEGLELHVHGNLPPYHGDSSYVESLTELAGEVPGLVLHGAFAHGGLAEVLAGLDGVAAPSCWEEVYGLTVREARAAGLPVLVSDAGDLPGVTAGGRAGRTVPRGDAAAWHAALADFLEDAEQRAAWAAHAVRPRSAAEMTEQLLGLYEGLLPGS
jgi:glycosyltransferase involved in cell wall biosynthesis